MYKYVNKTTVYVIKIGTDQWLIHIKFLIQCGELIHKLAAILPPNYISDNVHQLGGSQCSDCDDYCLLVLHMKSVV